jgi:hypothetical protein
MIRGAHVIVYSKDAEADRAFLRDVPGLEGVDAEHGWPIFALPLAEGCTSRSIRQRSEWREDNRAGTWRRCGWAARRWGCGGGGNRAGSWERDCDHDDAGKSKQPRATRSPSRGADGQIGKPSTNASQGRPAIRVRCRGYRANSRPTRARGQFSGRRVRIACRSGEGRIHMRPLGLHSRRSNAI